MYSIKPNQRMARYRDRVRKIKFELSYASITYDNFPKGCYVRCEYTSFLPNAKKWWKKEKAFHLAWMKRVKPWYGKYILASVFYPRETSEWRGDKTFKKAVKQRKRLLKKRWDFIVQWWNPIARHSRYIKFVYVSKN